MKKKNFLYSLAILALIALIAGVISYATERHPTQTDFSTTPVEQIATPMSSSTERQTSPIVKKKSCGCCAERMAHLQEQIRKARGHKQTAQHAEAIGVSQQTP